MITKKSSEFYSRLQRYIFVNPESEFTEDEILSKGEQGIDFAVVDVDDFCIVGVPIFEDIEFELYAILEPGEKYPGEE